MSKSIKSKGPEYWAPRVKSILSSHFGKLSDPNTSYPENLGIISMGVNRLMEISIGMDAMRGYLILSQIDRLISEIIKERLLWKKFQPELKHLIYSFEQNWPAEYAERFNGYSIAKVNI